MPEPTELPPIAAAPLSVLLAASASAAFVHEVVAAWIAELDKLGRDYEILLVDDGSSDGTVDLANAEAQRQPRLRVLAHATPRGLGAVVRTALAEARHPLFFYTTCDRQFQPADLKCLLDVIDKTHLVSGYRRSRPVPLALRLLGALYRGFVRVLCGEAGQPLPGWLGWSAHLRHHAARWLFGVHFQDVDCAFRLARRAIFERIPIQSDSAFAQMEILAKANFLSCVLAEEPVRHQPDPGRFQSTFRQRLGDAWRLLRHPDFGPPFLPGREPKELPPEQPASPEASAPAELSAMSGKPHGSKGGTAD